jgi:hypothetical protein
MHRSQPHSASATYARHWRWLRSLVVVALISAGTASFNPSAARASNAIVPGADGIGYYYQNDGSYHLRNALNGGSSDYPFVYGPANNTGIIPVAGDWDGDGEDSTGWFRQSDGTFHITNDNKAPRTFAAFSIGVTGSGIFPVAGDWDGDGEDTVGWFRQSDGSFHLSNDLLGGASSSAFVGAATGAGIIPVAGDWDGDKADSVGWFRQSDGSFHLRNALSNGTSDYAFTLAPGTTTGSILPVIGDWNGDGKDSAGWWNRSDSGFHLRNALSNGASDQAFVFGPADSNVWPLSGLWYVPPTPTGGTVAANPYGPAEITKGWTQRMQYVVTQFKAAHPVAGGRCAGQADGTQTGHIKNSDHYTGNAADCTQSTTGGSMPTTSQKAPADAGAQWLVDNANPLKIKYVIWYGRIWTPSQGWHSYCAGTTCPSSTSYEVTKNHYDHIHISVLH